jgi:hypothetical protein
MPDCRDLPRPHKIRVLWRLRRRLLPLVPDPYTCLWAMLPIILWWTLYCGYPSAVPVWKRRPVASLCFLPNMDRALQHSLTPISSFFVEPIPLDLSFIQTDTNLVTQKWNQTDGMSAECSRFSFANASSVWETPKRIKVSVVPSSLLHLLRGFAFDHSDPLPPYQVFIAGLFYSLHALLPLFGGAVALSLVSISTEDSIRAPSSRTPVPLGMALDWLCSYGWLNLVALTIHIVWPTAPPWFVFQQTGTMWPTAEQCQTAALGKTRVWYMIQRTGSAAGLLAIDRWLGVPVYASLFRRNRWVFAAFPSLHVATPAWIALRMTELRNLLASSQLGSDKLRYTGGAASADSCESTSQVAVVGPGETVLARLPFRNLCLSAAWIYTLCVSWSALYLGHHYAVDCIGGVSCAYVAECCHRHYWRWRQRPGRALSTYTNNASGSVLGYLLRKPETPQKTLPCPASVHQESKGSRPSPSLGAPEPERLVMPAVVCICSVHPEGFLAG